MSKCKKAWLIGESIRFRWRSAYSPIYLVRFFRNLLLKDSWVLKNRYLHIRPTDDWKEQPRIGTPQVPPQAILKYPTSTPQVQSTCGDSYSIL